MTAVYLYKTLHLVGMALLLTSLGGLAAHAASGGSKATNSVGRLLALAHGLGLVLMLVGGFGLLARLDLSMTGGWIWVKLLLWLGLGAASVLPYRSPKIARSLLIVLPLAAGLAAFMALFKPF